MRMPDELSDIAVVPAPPFGLSIFEVAVAAASHCVKEAAARHRARRDPEFEATYSEEKMGTLHKVYAGSSAKKAAEILAWAARVAEVDNYSDTGTNTVAAPKCGLFEVGLSAGTWFHYEALRLEEAATHTGVETSALLLKSARYKKIAVELQGWCLAAAAPDEIGCPGEFESDETGVLHET
ncbi:hypothetical protein G6L32_14220 [Agrobacterium tumefaciens]|uniref:hypothetical protein n=1 Tax=Agrobacterium tumefaciens TaxID=358 RepID=UPI0015729DBB|nr:hypothetical protein [Agrobacterium tumefaciens]